MNGTVAGMTSSSKTGSLNDAMSTSVSVNLVFWDEWEGCSSRMSLTNFVT